MIPRDRHGRRERLGPGAGADDTEKITCTKIAQALAFESLADRTAIINAAGDVLSPRDWPQELRGLIVSLDITQMIDAAGKVTSQRYKVKFAAPTPRRRCWPNGGA